jgi:hypothetical protein
MMERLKNEHPRKSLHASYRWIPHDAECLQGRRETVCQDTSRGHLLILPQHLKKLIAAPRARNSARQRTSLDGTDARREYASKRYKFTPP